MKRLSGIAIALLLCSGPVFSQTLSSQDAVPAEAHYGKTRAEVKAELVASEKAGLMPMNDPNYPAALVASSQGSRTANLTAPQTLARQTR
ncbi:uncharacterized protein DUF4148 [Paraburkholderia unamae]|uniref:Uncharacterized protein DUF4148 n=2 Tax=Paraburkholderia unamae TaxID=219649 RepID=A0ABX5KUE0_9BURK|nr:uncharacterized protein DUF4148 [Paraburkholderia unamae]